METWSKFGLVLSCKLLLVNLKTSKRSSCPQIAWKSYPFIDSSGTIWACSRCQVFNSIGIHKNKKIPKSFVLASLWKVHRKLLNPSFSPKILQSFIPIFNEKAITLAKLLDKEVTAGSVFDVYPYLNATAMDMVCSK